eukprot:SAG22_NODE_1427_length_4455_cov_1.597107_3_plen_280_part_00
MRARGPLFFVASCVMVMLQSMTALALCVSIVFPPCANSDMCGSGQFCAIALNNRCQFCGSNVPLYMQTDAATGATYNFIFDPHFVGFNRTYVADFCADPTIGSCANVCADPDRSIGDLQGRPCGYFCWDSPTAPSKLDHLNRINAQGAAVSTNSFMSEFEATAEGEETFGSIIFGFHSTGEACLSSILHNVMPLTHAVACPTISCLGLNTAALHQEHGGLSLDDGRSKSGAITACSMTTMSTRSPVPEPLRTTFLRCQLWSGRPCSSPPSLSHCRSSVN